MTSVSEKSGMDKINESMEKIGAMLGVQASSSNIGKDNSVTESKQQPLITNNGSDDSTPDRLVAMNSAEGRVVGPPVSKSDTQTIHTERTGATRPTTPGKTKTAAGAAIANLAASVDNTVNKVGKSVRKMRDSGCGPMDTACGGKDPESGTVDSNGVTTVTDYVSIEKPGRGTTPNWVYVSVGAALITLVILAITAAVPGTKLNNWFQNVNDDIAASNDVNMSVAFIGNSYLYVNDVPRVMECISKGRISQQSVINTGAGLGSLLKQGNGMYELWGNSPNALDYWGSFDFKALMESVNVEIDDDYNLYDYGYCTVPQLLDGYDNYLSFQNQNGVYFDVGTNPCFEDEYYMMIIQEKSYQSPMYFDFVVLNDQTRRMANEEGREDSLDALAQAYAALIKTSRAVPILVDTHAFSEDFENYQDEYADGEDGEDAQNYDYQDVEDAGEEEEYQENNAVNYAEYYGVDAEQWNATKQAQGAFTSSEIAEFTAQIYEGLYQYRDILKYNLPAKQSPRIAKVGLAYLAIYEDNQKMYHKLFASDGVHASQHGTYLFACVLYCTIYGHLPMSVHDEFDVRSVFFKSRSLFGNNEASPSVSDANYLRAWARKVQVDGYVPKTMVFPEPQEEVAGQQNWWNRNVTQAADDEVN